MALDAGQELIFFLLVCVALRRLGLRNFLRVLSYRVRNSFVQTDSTIAPIKTSDFLQRTTFHGCSTQGRIPLRKTYPCIFLVCKGLTIDDVGVSRNTVFQEIRPGDGLETADFVKQELGRPPQNESAVGIILPRG